MNFRMPAFYANERGALLPGTLILLMVTGLLAFSFLKTSSHEHTFVEHEYRELELLWDCEEALSRARAELQSMPLERIPDISCCSIRRVTPKGVRSSSPEM